MMSKTKILIVICGLSFLTSCKGGNKDRKNRSSTTNRDEEVKSPDFYVSGEGEVADLKNPKELQKVTPILFFDD